MLITAIIAFREFLEAFLLIGIFLGMDRKLQLGKRKEILIAALLGIVISLVLPIIVFFFSSTVSHTLTESNMDIVEGYFLSFSGFFLVYVIFSIHEFLKLDKKKTIAKANQKMEQKIFDISLFLTIIFFITREGFEIALLVATTSLFSVFQTNIEGLMLGFGLASFVGTTTSLAYAKLPIKKVFLYTEYLIIIIGAAMVKNGVSMLLENYLHIHLEKFMSLPLGFLPNGSTILGHAINNLFGLQREMGIIQVGIMSVYVLLVWSLFRTHNNKPTIVQ